MLQRINDYFATVYAKQKYAKMVRTCEAYHQRSTNKVQVCVITHPVHRDKLLYIDKSGLSKLLKSMPLKKSSKISFKTVRDGAWYFTARSDGKGGMTPEQMEARKRVWVESYIKSDNRKLRAALKKVRRKRKIKATKDKICEIFTKSGRRVQENCQNPTES